MAWIYVDAPTVVLFSSYQVLESLLHFKQRPNLVISLRIHLVELERSFIVKFSFLVLLVVSVGTCDVEVTFCRVWIQFQGQEIGVDALLVVLLDVVSVS